MEKQIEIKLIAELVAEGRYYLNGTRLNFDEPWAVYLINNDMYMPYYRIYINNEFRGVALYEQVAFNFLINAKDSLACRL